MNTDFIWEDFNHPKLKELREAFNLEKIVKSGKDEFEKQLLLASWIFKTLPLGYNNQNNYQTAIEVLNDKNNVGGFNCTWYVLVYLQCATALGWNARKLGIDTDHKFSEEEKRHTVVDIWSEKFNKWYVIDPMFNCHFEKNNIPQNSYEIRKLSIEKDQDYKKIFGINEEEQLPEKIKNRHNTPENYFWFSIYLRNNFLENPNIYDSKVLLWVDEYNKNKTWYVGGENKGEFKKHPMYEGSFVDTDDYGECFPTINL